MFERVLTTADGRTPPVAQSHHEPADSHRTWLKGLLEESPASLQELTLVSLPEGNLTMEWQAVFTGAGVAYLHLAGSLIAACLLLEGRHSTSELAAIDALQQTLQLKSRSAGFEQIRRNRARPLRAMVLMQDVPRSEVVDALTYWADCLARAYFSTLSSGPAELRPGGNVALGSR